MNEEKRTDLRAEIAREVVQQVADLQGEPPEEEALLAVRAALLERVVRRVLAQFGIR